LRIVRRADFQLEAKLASPQRVLLAPLLALIGDLPEFRAVHATVLPTAGHRADTKKLDLGAPTAYRVTSLIRKRTPLGPYRRPMPRVLGGS